MYRVLSFTSFQKTQKLIKKVLFEHADEFCLCGQFSSAIDAMEIAPFLKPDIILLSDTMLFVDPMTFMHALAKRGLRISYILLCNHPENLSNNKRTSLIDAVSYETTLTEDILLELLHKTCERKSENKDFASSISSYLADDTWMIQSQFFARLINESSYDDDTVPSYVKTTDGYLILAVPETSSNNSVSFFKNVSNTISFLNHAQLLIELYGKGNYFIIQENRLGIWFKPYIPDHEGTDCFYEFCNSINSLFFDYFKSSLTFQRSDKCIELSAFGQIYRAVDKLCKYRFFLSDEVILTSHWLLQHSVEVQQNHILNLIASLNSSFDNKVFSEVQNIIDDLFYCAKNSLSLNTYTFIWNQLIFWYNTKVQDIHLPPAQYTPSFGHTSFNRLTEAMEAITNLIKELYTAVHQINMTDNLYINQAMEYLKKHRTEPVTLSNLAEEIHISSAYLSLLFQKVLKTSFSKIRAQLRIDLSKQYLKEGYKIYEVAAMSGFSNEKYFSSTFKQLTGMTPKQYQSQHKGEHL